MESHTLYIELERERRKLNRLVTAAIKNGTPITQNGTILEQSRKVDTLVNRIQEVREKHRQNQQER